MKEFFQIWEATHSESKEGKRAKQKSTWKHYKE